MYRLVCGREEEGKGVIASSLTPSQSHIHIHWPVAPVAYQVILEPGIGQFRELESPECILV